MRPKVCTVTAAVLFSYCSVVLTNFMDPNFRKNLLILKRLEKSVTYFYVTWMSPKEQQISVNM